MLSCMHMAIFQVLHTSLISLAKVCMRITGIGTFAPERISLTIVAPDDFVNYNII